MPSLEVIAALLGLLTAWSGSILWAMRWVLSSQRRYVDAKFGALTTLLDSHAKEMAKVERELMGLIDKQSREGLTEQSRIGETTLNPFIGPRFKSIVLTVDMPLITDKSIDYGLQYFCTHCYKCARECPCNAIPFRDKVMFNGYETWKPDSERCTRYRFTNMKGSACGRCVKVCPLTKDTTFDGPLHVQIES